VTSHECPGCGRAYDLVTGFVFEDEDAHAIYYAACHRHQDLNEVWLDIALGDWDEALTDQVTFACRVGPEGASLVTPPVAAEGKADFFGRMLTRDEALQNERLSTLWAVVDFVLTTDVTIRDHFYRSA
jgi:hypothetical protein